MFLNSTSVVCATWVHCISRIRKCIFVLGKFCIQSYFSSSFLRYELSFDELYLSELLQTNSGDCSRVLSDWIWSESGESCSVLCLSGSTEPRTNSRSCKIVFSTLINLLIENILSFFSIYTKYLSRTLKEGFAANEYIYI